MSNNHTCNYCDGTLISVRPACPNCGHALCQEIYPKQKGTRISILDWISGRRFDSITDKVEIPHPYTICPKCFNIVYLSDNFSEVIYYL